MDILAWIVVGLIAGFLAGQVMRGGGYGIVGDMIIGIVGAVLGGFLAARSEHPKCSERHQHHQYFRRLHWVGDLDCDLANGVRPSVVV